MAVKLMAALNFYATGSFQSPNGDVCDISQSSVHTCEKQVTEALYARAGQYIKFNLDQAHQEAQAAGFAAFAGVPNVQGAVDCTHVALRAPLQNPRRFLNRKGFHSLNVQIVCDRPSCTSAPDIQAA